MVGGFSCASAIQADAGGGVRLRIDVHQQNCAAHARKHGSEIDRCRGLANTALLICDSYDFRHQTRSEEKGTVTQIDYAGHDFVCGKNRTARILGPGRGCFT